MPTGGMSLPRAGSQAGEVSTESLDRITVDRAPRAKDKDLLGPKIDSVGRVLAYYREVAKETGAHLGAGV